MLTTQIEFKVGSALSSALDLSSKTKVGLDFAKTFSLTSGVGQSQADQLWFDSRNILASGNDDLDLAGGVTNGLGQTVTFVRIKAIVLYSKASNLNPIHMGGGLSPFSSWVGAAGDILRIMPGGLQVLVAPDPTAYPVTPGSADILRITNSAGGTAVDYEIVLVGTTA